MEHKPLLPSEILAAVAHVRKTNPSDTYGLGAFRAKFGEIKASPDGSTKYIPFEVLRKEGEKWEFVPLHLRFLNLVTKGKIPAANDPKREYGVTLSFRKSSSFERKNSPGDVSRGAPKTVVEKFGLACYVINQAHKLTYERLLAEKKVNTKNQTICELFQTERRLDATGLHKAAIEDPIFRPSIPFKKSGEGKQKFVKADEPPSCEIYDLEKPISNPPRGKAPFELAVYTNPETGATEPLSWANIGSFITGGSVCSGVIDMSQTCFSAMGISLPHKVTLLMVKRSKGFRPEAGKVFSSSDFEEMAASEAEPEEEEVSSGLSEEALSLPGNPEGGSGESDFKANDGDDFGVTNDEFD